eukprot:Nitzschia sp. Nitz4//scaffold110_size71422//51910//53997//NITZ4_005880-RA/size71422-processed-gene-0.73-mRNA-1//-1//CDS//3329533107//3100//frame0
MPFVSFDDFAPGGYLASSKDFDFIVVGAGTAGCPLASRLSEDPSIKVLLIESGPKDHALEDRINKTIPVAVAKLQHSAYDWEYYAEPQLPNACTRINTFQGAKPETNCRSFWPRGKGLGGSSCINYMAWVRGHPNDYDEWESKHGAKGWGWKDIGPLFRDRIENVSECDPKHVPSAGHGSSGCYGISTRNPLSNLAVQFVNACEAVGFTAGDYNFCPTAGKSVHNGVGVAGVMQQSVRRGTRCDAARVYIDPLLRGRGNSRPNLFVLAGATCESLILENDQQGSLSAQGVHLVPDSEQQDKAISLNIHASKEVILSAGALGSPQILLKSGIGPDGKSLKLSQVGKNMFDHPTAFLRFPPKLGQGKQDIGSMNSSKAEGLGVFVPNVLNMLLGGRGVLTSCCYDATLFYSSYVKNGSTEASPNLQVGFFAATADKGLAQNNLGMNFDDMMVDSAEWRPDAEGVHFVCTLLQPKSKGTLAISSDGKRNNGLTIHPEYFTDKDQQDLKNVVDSIRTAIRIAQSVPFQNLLSPMPCWPKDLCVQYNVPHLSDPSPSTILGADEYPTRFLEEYVRRYATTLYHPTSTCRMGRNSNIGVVDYSLKVFGVKGLRVADASVQPQIVSGNTQASCVAIGEKAADIIREEYSLVSNAEELLVAIDEYEQRGHRKVVATMTLVVTIPMLLMIGVVSRGGWKTRSSI